MRGRTSARRIAGSALSAIADCPAVRMNPVPEIELLLTFRSFLRTGGASNRRLLAIHPKQISAFRSIERSLSWVVFFHRRRSPQRLGDYSSIVACGSEFCPDTLSARFPTSVLVGVTLSVTLRVNESSNIGEFTSTSLNKALDVFLDLRHTYQQRTTTGDKEAIAFSTFTR